MAVVSDLNKVSVALKLNNGTKDGKVQTVSLSLGTLSKDRYDNQKALNIKSLLAPVLDKPILNVQETKVSLLSDAD